MTAKEKHISKDARSSIKNKMTCICSYSWICRIL